jgi:hypothetical protein
MDVSDSYVMDTRENPGNFSFAMSRIFSLINRRGTTRKSEKEIESTTTDQKSTKTPRTSIPSLSPFQNYRNE